MNFDEWRFKITVVQTSVESTGMQVVFHKTLIFNSKNYPDISVSQWSTTMWQQLKPTVGLIKKASINSNWCRQWWCAVLLNSWIALLLQFHDCIQNLNSKREKQTRRQKFRVYSSTTNCISMKSENIHIRQTDKRLFTSKLRVNKK